MYLKEVLTMSKLLEYAALKEEERKEAAMKAEKRTHKCNGCMWGKWTGNKFSCMFQNCVKNKL